MKYLAKANVDAFIFKKLLCIDTYFETIDEDLKETLIPDDQKYKGNFLVCFFEDLEMGDSSSILVQVQVKTMR